MSNKRHSSSSIREKIHEMPDQDVLGRYICETRKLKTLNLWRAQGKQGARPCRYPNLGMMNLSKRELERRGLPVPPVDLPAEQR
jgi:hypothetical protein